MSLMNMTINSPNRRQDTKSKKL